MFNGLFQPTHLILILVVVLIVFGPGKLPEAGKALGKAMKDMRDAFASNEETKNQTEQPANGVNTGNVVTASETGDSGTRVSGTGKDKKAG